MKKLSNFSVLLFISACLLAQIPEKMSYQAVIRDASGALVTNSTIGMQISILQGSASGTPVYTESQTPETNNNGLVSIEIGDGSALTGSFPDIDWSGGTFFIKTEVDPEGGTNYTISGTSQVLSVPFALHAKTAETVNFTEEDPIFTESAASAITEEDMLEWDSKPDKAGEGIEITDYTISLKNKLKVGDLHMEGIVFFIDNSGEHGLVASLDDLDGGEGVIWSDNLNSEVGPTAQSATDGATNTEAILAHQNTTSAAQLCRNLGPEWYLPSNRELYLLFSQEILIDQILDNDGDPATNGFIQEKFPPTYSRYWSSTESNADFAWNYKAPSGDSSPYDKSSTYRVRAIRAF